MKRISKIFITIILMLLIIITYGARIITMAAEPDLVITPKPETNNIHLKWTGPQNSSYRVYQKKPGATQFETIGLTDFNNIDEEVKVLNIYPTRESVVPEVLTTEQPIVIPNISVTYKDRK